MKRIAHTSDGTGIMCVETNQRAMVLITGVWSCIYEKTFLRNYVTYLLTFFLTFLRIYLLHGAQSILRS